MMRKRATFSGSMLGMALALLLASPVLAGPIPCDPATCGWSISVNGNEVMSGAYEIDEDGNLSLAAPVSMTTPDFSVSIDSIGGNVDPEIVFGLGATNTSGSAQTYAFAFSLPLGGFTGLIDTYAELGQTLSAVTGDTDGLTMFPTSGTGFIVDSQDIRFSPFSSVDKGVDVGDVLFAPDGSTVLDLDTASSQILLSGGYDLMSVIVAFGLDSDGGVGLSGRVRQTIVPEPGTALLVGLGVLALAIRQRTRRV